MGQACTGTVTPLPAHVLEQAAEWFVLLASGEAGEKDRSRWKAWLRADPAHEQAWRRAEVTAGRLADIPSDQARASMSALTRTSKLKSRGRRNALKGFVLMIAVGIAGVQGYRYSDGSADAVTAVGEQRAMTLADGSRILLDTDSAIDVEFSEDSRLIRLRRGQILIETGHRPEDGDRGLAVQTAEGRVIALGTRFTVRQEPDSTRVTVLESRVALRADRATGKPPILQAGESARFTRGGLVQRSRASQVDTGWITGMLIANDMPLRDFVAELSRYSADPIACDPAVEALRISGSFPLEDIERILGTLGNILPVRVGRTEHFTGKVSLVVSLE